MGTDTQQLAHLVKTSYLPQFRKDIDSIGDEDITKPLLEQRYKEVEALCNKYLDN